jgi:Recombination directionality factor-like
MPLPLIERQRAYTRIGEIRCGDEKTGNRPGAKLDTFRVTSQHKDILERVAQLYGGQVKPWKSPSGDAWQVVTASNALPCMVIPGYSLKRSYELWEGPSKRVRMCDGEEEYLSGGPCICNAQGKDECKLLTRLMVLLPETGTSLGWQVSSTGETAADELDLAMLLAEGIANGRTFVPARLRLTQRRGQLNGQATRFVVPVLDLDPPGQRRLGEGQPALPPGYTPIERNPEEPLSLEEGLRVAEAQQLAKPPRVALPEDDVDDDELGAEPGAAPGPAGGGETPDGGVESAPAPPPALEESSPRGNSIAHSTQDKPLTGAQAKKLDVLVGSLRDAGHITTEMLYVKLARLRNINVDVMIELTEQPVDDGRLHWAPLRQSLTRGEANQLIDALSEFEAQLEGTEA